MKDKILNLLGFASKAGKLSFGFEATVGAIKSGKAKLVLIACDISPKSRKETVYFADKFGVCHIELEDIDIETLSAAVGKKCGILSVYDQGFAEGILKFLLH